MAFRAEYWSNSKFANWIRKTKKPVALTFEEWDEWEKETAKSHPIRYWIAEKFLDGVQNFINWPYDKLYDMTYYIRNRWIDKSHYCRTGLKPGQWHETDEKILHGMMEELVDFVRNQKGWMMYCSERDQYKDLPFWKTTWPFRHFGQFDSEELGLKYLRWEITLKQDDSWFGIGDWSTEEEKEKVRSNPEYGKPTHQAHAAMEILDIYQWWTKIRPCRKDPHDASGWTEFCDAMELKYGSRFHSFSKETEAEKKMSSQRLDKLHEIEKQYEDEDTYYLIRLINIRKSLWT